MADKKKRKGDEKGAIETPALASDSGGEGAAPQPAVAEKTKKKKKRKGARKGGQRARGRKQSPKALGLRTLIDFARASRKRLARLAKKLQSVSTKRAALLDELEKLHRAIGDVLGRARAGTGSAAGKQADETPAAG